MAQPIIITPFEGERPGVEPHLLDNNRAQIAENCDLLTGALAAIKTDLFENTPTKVGTKKTIYRWGNTPGQNNGYWLHWLNEVNVVRGPIAGDTEERTYYTGDGAYPKMTYAGLVTAGGGTDYPNSSYRLGVPTPATPISALINGAATDPNEVPERRVYVYTYVSEKNEEGPPSAPSNPVEWRSGQTVDLSNFSGAPGGEYNITVKRIYRVNTGNNGAEYQFVADIPVATATYNDAIADTALGEALPSTDWLPPPDDLKGLVDIGNGMLAGISKNQLCISEPYQPHAWPLGYRKTSSYPIVAIGACANSIVVGTTGQPYIAIGSSPDSMSFERIEMPYPCVSSRFMVDMGHFVLYGTADGIVLASSSRFELATEGVVTPEQWRAYNPYTMHAYRYGELCVIFYDNGTQGCLIFDPRRKDFMRMSLYATAGYEDKNLGALFLQVGDDIVKWQGGATYRTAKWRSKLYLTRAPSNYGAAKVEAYSYPVTFRLYADGALKHTEAVANNLPFVLPSNYLANRWEVEIEGTAKVRYVVMAASVGDVIRLGE